jgi:hypothetical protein
LIKVGEREVLLNVTTFVPQDEEAEVKVELGENDHLIMIFAFEESHDSSTKEKGNASYEISGVGDKGKITFKNWTATFGSSITKPVYFATDNEGRRISLLANIVKLGAMYKVDCQFMRGGNEDG